MCQNLRAIQMFILILLPNILYYNMAAYSKILTSTFSFYWKKIWLPLFHFIEKEEKYQEFDTSLNYFYPDPTNWPISVAFLHLKSIWKKGQKKEAIDKISSLLMDQRFVPQIEADQQLKCRVYYTNAKWLFGNSNPHSIFFNLKRAVDLLEISMRTKIRFYKSFHYWAWSCSLMFMKASNVK